MAQPTIFKVVKNRRVPDDHKPAKGEAVKYRFVVDVGTETVTDPTTGKRKERRKQLTRTFRRKREAEEALSKILAEVDGGTFVAPAPTKLNELLDEWLRSLRDIEENTRASYVNGLKPARERLGEKPAQKITVKDVNDLVDWMLTSGRKRGGQPGTSLGPRSVQLTLSRLRAAFAWGIPLRMVSINPAAMVKSPKQSKVKRKPWTAAEMTQFATSLAGKRLEAPAWLALLGIGPAELCGERWAQDVDLDAETITTADNTRTLTWDDEGGHVVEKGKTDGRVRTLPLIPQITTALRSFKTQQARERLAAGDGYEPTGYVLVDEVGRPFKTDQWRRAMYKLMDEAGVRRVRPYDARHSCLTYLAVNGVPDVIVSAWAGHADLTTAKKHYVHPSADDLQQGRAALAKLFG